MRRLLLLLSVCALLSAQTAVNVRTGGLACAAIRRPSAQVQTYCYEWPPAPAWVLIHNQISTVPIGGYTVTVDNCVALIGGLIISFAPCKVVDTTKCTTADAITWQFTRIENGNIMYAYTTSHDGVVQPLVTGTLP